MKTLSTLFLISWISLQLVISQTPNFIPNASFEDWKADTLFHIWEDFTTTNTAAYYYTGMPTVTAVQAPLGQAARLSTHIIGTDTAVGELVLGAFCPTGFLGGMAYSDRPDSLIAYVRYEVTSPDNASIVLVFKQNEAVKHVKYFPLNGSRPNYYRLAMPLNLPAGPVDYNQLAMVISSSNKSKAIAGSWLEVDSLALTGGVQQPVNPSFNEVSLLHYEDPDGWASANISFGLFGSVVGISKSTDAYDGMFAAKIQTVDYVSNCEPDTFGFLGEGTWDVIDGQDGGQPFDLVGGQMAFSGYYKYEPVGNDTAMVGMVFTQYNAMTGERDTVHTIIQALAPTVTYQRFEVRFETADFSILPDSFHLVFQASDPDNYASQGVQGAGSSLWIDQLEMNTTVGIQTLNNIPLQLYPNPTRDAVHLEWEAQVGHRYDIQMLDMHGRNVLQASSHTGEIQLDIAKLPAGMYFVTLSDPQNKLRSSMKLVKK